MTPAATGSHHWGGEWRADGGGRGCRIQEEIASVLIMPCRKVIPAVTRSRILAVIAALVLCAAGGSVAYIVIPARPPAPEIQRPVMAAWPGG